MAFLALPGGLSWPMWSVAASRASGGAEAREADEVDFEALFRRHTHDVHRLVWRLLGPGADAADVDDLCQQIFLAIHDALPKFRGDSKVSTWVYGIASRIVYRELRRRTRHRRMVRALEAKTAALEARTPGAPLPEVRLELADVWRQLMKIHPKKRMVFVLAEIEGLDGPQIAKILDIKEPTVHSRLYYARRELMRALEAER